ncbi:MAG: ABC transporter substrate-binding protein [Betaproteobacteria bacterium]|nr:ABC transporter substrate-binding protein [Betaproteobacteria bacterium]
MTTRREILFALGTLAALPVYSQQSGKVWRVGFLATPSRPQSIEADVAYGAFLQGMKNLGGVEGKTFVMEWRFGDNNADRLSGLAAELVALKVDVIMTRGSPATSAAQKATRSIPIVMGGVGDPLGSGFVKSLARPEANITGLSQLIVDISPKYLEMMIGMVPKIARVAILVNPGNVSHDAVVKSIQAAAPRTNVTIQPIDARNPKEIEAAFLTMLRERAGGAIILPDPLFTQQRHQIAELQARHRLPCIASFREYVDAGALLSYGLSLEDHFRRAATYVEKILKGARPGDLPVEQPTTFELIINRKTAKALGLTIPQSLLISATQVID